tara:strand:- start:2829 stop:3323 length:495 start_codon:yes stop_codon:yes gene_type:complete
MKQILILRHAKSSWDNSNIIDFERPLADRGIRDAKKLSNFIKKSELILDKVICSSASRAKETFDLVADSFNFLIEKATYTDELYFGDASNIINKIKTFDESFKNILIVGHNPTLHFLVESLTNNNIARFTTCNLAIIYYEYDWIDLAPGKCSLKSLIKPKEIKD